MKLLYLVAAMLAIISVSGLAAATPVPISLGPSIVDLTGPWRFHTGDDPAWADPNFDDSTWEVVDLTAPAGAHDDDVGLTGYVPGWGARGHRGYIGYAWYRLHVAIAAPGQQPFALSGPPAVDSAYQVFVNGRLLGGIGRFTGRAPTVVSIQPRVFAIPSDTAIIAFRVWMGAWDLGDPGAGGIHIAPSLGLAPTIDARYQLQWLQTVRGYVVEVAEAAAFLLLTVMAYTLSAFDPVKPPYRWLCAGLVLLALYRANQAVFLWGQFETVQAFEMVSVVILIPSCLAAWTLAWRAWFRLRDAAWMPITVGVLTLLYMAAQFLTRSWFLGVFPHWVGTIGEATRFAFLLLNAFIVYRALRQQGPKSWFALTAAVVVDIGLFAREVSMLGVPGIWFPFGTGVSRTQYAYAVFDVVMFVFLSRRFLLFAQSHRTPSAPSQAAYSLLH